MKASSCRELGRHVLIFSVEARCDSQCIFLHMCARDREPRALVHQPDTRMRRHTVI